MTLLLATRSMMPAATAVHKTTDAVEYRADALDEGRARTAVPCRLGHLRSRLLRKGKMPLTLGRPCRISTR